MFFEDPKRPLKFTLRCDCGKVSPDIPSAIKDMREPMGKSPVVVAVVAALMAAGFVALLALFHPRPAIPLAGIPAADIKADREKPIRIIPIVRQADAEPEPPIGRYYPPIVQPVELPRVLDPPVHKNQPVAQNICDRTGGRKVETNNGRSWHCEYNHRN
jgi:hypothetical protein